LRNCYVQTIIDCSTDFDVRLRNPKCEGALLIHQPTLTPQNSGTTNGLIAVWPVNPEVVWASGRAGTFTVTTDGEKTP
jgi:hypothetical protein